MLGIVGGSAFLHGHVLDGCTPQRVVTPRGDVMLHVGNGFAFLRRHGETGYTAPHRIPHHAHVLALESVGARHVVGFASTGSLHRALRPGAVLVPDDYVSLHPPPTLAGDGYLHIVPMLDPALRELLAEAAEAAGAEELRRGGIYVQTHGPRFETPAEVRMIANWGDVVGMTAASEATLFQERGMAYATLCIVDNYANGVAGTALTLDSFQAQLAAGATLARRIVDEVLRLWREQQPLPQPDGGSAP
ncbi:MAG TPA: MTAP family purine nucleoside phosphorylase [Longimicrobiales bacterium]|nr:MTAP family purine nucleoside phosphorylase [Longimicrobiales bacterium]